MQLSAKDAWKRILDEAHSELPDHTIRTWLEPTEAIALDEGRLIIGAPDQFAVEWNETKHATLLSRLAEPVLGQPTSIVFRVNEDRQKRPQMDFFVAPSRRRPQTRRSIPAPSRSTSGTPSIRSSSVSPTSSPPPPHMPPPSRPARPTIRCSSTARPAWARPTSCKPSPTQCVSATPTPGCCTWAPSNSSTR